MTCFHVLGGLSVFEFTVDCPDLSCVFDSVILRALLHLSLHLLPLIDDVARCFQVASEISLAVLEFDRPMHAIFLLIILLMKLSIDMLHHTHNVSNVFDVNHVGAHERLLHLSGLVLLDVDEGGVVASGLLLEI